MKKTNIKLFCLLFAAFTMTATMVSCGNDDTKPNPETNTGGTNSFNGSAVISHSTVKAWGSVKFTYQPEPMYDANENLVFTSRSIVVNGNEVFVDSLHFTSPIWGEGKFDLTTNSGKMAVPRRDPQSLEITGDPIIYEATISGSRQDKVFTIQIPELMGGTTIITNIGFSASPALAIPNSYAVNSYVDNTSNYFAAKSYPSAGETMIIALNPTSNFKTVNIQFTSLSTPSWGTFIFENVTVSQKATQYIIEGEGKTNIVNHNTGNAKDYVANISATIKNGVITGEISIPSVMGGITIHLNPEDFDTVVNSGN